MVEILLALGVVAIGICSIMVLFPVGVNANKDAAIDSNSSNVAEQALHFANYMFTNQFSADNTTWDNHVNYIPDKDSRETNPVDHDDISDHLLDDTAHSYWNDCTVANNSPLHGATWFRTTIYERTTQPGVYQIVTHHHPDDTIRLGDTGFEDNVDFRAVMVFTRSQIVLDENTEPAKKIDYRYGFTLTADISWPAERPLSQRKTARYSINIYRSN